MTIVAGNVVVQNVAADGAAFGEAVVIVNSDRLYLGYALNVQGEQADVGVTGAVGDLVGDLLLEQFTIGEADLGGVAQDIGVAAVRLDEEGAVIALDLGDLAVALLAPTLCWSKERRNRWPLSDESLARRFPEITSVSRNVATIIGCVYQPLVSLL